MVSLLTAARSPKLPLSNHGNLASEWLLGAQLRWLLSLKIRDLFFYKKKKKKRMEMLEICLGLSVDQKEPILLLRSYIMWKIFYANSSWVFFPF